MIKKKILVVGGGFRGILTANQLKENNSIDLIEKSILHRRCSFFRKMEWILS